MTLALLPVPLFKATDANGLPLALGKLYAFAAGTDTPQALLAADGSTPLAHPVVLDASGQAEVRLGPNAYKLNLLSALDVQQSGWPVDNVSSLAPTVLGDYSANATQMRLTTDPGESGSESLATSLAGEVERLRYAQYETKRAIDPSITYWYETPYGPPLVFNVKAYGAVGDGATDDTTAVAAALAAVPTTGGTLFFPPGTYVFSSGLDLQDRQNLTLAGSTSARLYLNSQGTTLKYTAASGALLTYNGARGVRITGLNLTYSHASYASNFLVIGQGTGAQDASELLIEDCSIMGNTAGSMDATALIKCGEEMYDLVIQRCQFSGARVAILGSSASIINANAVTIRHNLFLSPFSVAQIQVGGQQWNIEGNTFEPRTGTQGSAIYDTTVGVYQISITNNFFVDGNSASTVWLQLSNGPTKGAFIAGNTFEDINAGSQAISFGSQAAEGVTILGNKLHCGKGILGDNIVSPFIGGNDYSYGGGTGLHAYPVGPGLMQNKTEYRFHVADTSQTDAMLSARATSGGTTSGNCLEWGHWNSAGYASTLGFTNNAGRPFVAFAGESGTNSNTYKTRGQVARILEYQASGGLIIGRAATASADNQSLTEDLSISSTGRVTVGSGTLVQKVVTLTYGTTITPDLNLGNVFVITITDNVNFTIANPSAQGGDGSVYYFVLVNSSGGAHGTISWGGQYHRAASASLTVANASNQTICFVDAGGAGSVYYEAFRTGGDVPN